MPNPGLYVHVPFCRSRCTYCDFCSTIRGGEADRWLAALDREAESAAGLWEPFDTLYIGGGTPSSLTPGQLCDLIRILHEHFIFAPDTVVTLEANPADIDMGSSSMLADLGVNRVSVGGQSFDNRTLSFLGRRHRAERINMSVDMLRAGGIGQVSIDLIYGVPGQSLDHWLETLRLATALEPEHLSCYQLTIERNTPLGCLLEKGEIREVDEETARRFFLDGADYLQRLGFEHYEVSNFSRGLGNRSRHNMKYWTHLPYLGLGPSAHSFDGASRWWNSSSLDDYIQRLEDGGSPVDGRETLSGEQLEMERIALGLRLAEGFELAALSTDPEKAEKLKQLGSLGLLTLDGGRVVPTCDGLLMADGIARELCC